MSQPESASDPAVGEAPAPRRGPSVPRAPLRPYSMGEYKGAPEGARRLHLNEFRYEHPPSVVAAAERAAQALGPARLLTEYPAGPDPGLAADLAAYVGAPSAEHVLVTPGSDEALRAAVDIAAARGYKTVLMGAPGYTHFEHYVRLRGLELATYSLGFDGAASPLGHHAAIVACSHELLAEGCLVYLCSPNNPTGHYWGAGDVAKLAHRHPRSLFLLDEAYIEYTACALTVNLWRRGPGEVLKGPESLDPPPWLGEGSKDREVEELCGYAGGLALAAAQLADTEKALGAAQPSRSEEEAVARCASSRLKRWTAERAASARCSDPNAVKWDTAQRLNAWSAAPVALFHPNLVVSRTLSKAFGLAALRVGYLVGQPALLAELRAAVNPKACGPLAAAVARAALREGSHYLEKALAARLQGARAVLGLRARGWYATETPGNFYLVHVGDSAAASAAATAALAARGVLVRDRGTLGGLAGFVRVTAGTPEDTTAVLEAFGALRPPPEPPLQLFHTDKLRVAQVRALVRTTVRILGEAGLAFFATSGTLLGMFRHGGMIPWDNDADLGYVRDPRRDQLLDLVPAFRAAGLTCQRNRTDAYWQVGTNPPGLPISPAHVDVFSFRAVFRRRPGDPGVVIQPDLAEDADRAGGCGAFGGSVTYEVDDVRYITEEPDSPNAECNIRCAHDELFPLRSGAERFYDLPIPVPALAGHLLARSLGEDFMAVAKIRTEAGLVTRALTDLAPA